MILILLPPLLFLAYMSLVFYYFNDFDKDINW